MSFKNSISNIKNDHNENSERDERSIFVLSGLFAH